MGIKLPMELGCWKSSLGWQYGEGKLPQGYELAPVMDLATATEHHLSATSCSSADVWLHASGWEFVFPHGLSRAVVDVHTLRFQAHHSGPQTLRRRSEGSTDGDLH